MSVAAMVSPLLQIVNQFLGFRGCLFTFHRAASAQAWQSLPNRDFYLNLDFLDEVLRHLSHNGWDIVTLDEAIARTSSVNKSKQKFVNFSVDDCYRDTFEDVVPLFREHQKPVTLFVTTGIPDERMTLWHVGLEDILLNRDQLILEDETLDVSTAELKRKVFHTVSRRFDNFDADKFYARICELNGANALEIHRKHAVTWDMLAQLKNDPLVEIGGHTLTHPHIASLAAGDAFEQLSGCRKRLQEKLNLPIQHFAFPYGRGADCGIRDFQLAQKAGFTTAATTIKGFLRSPNQFLSLPRITLNGSHQSMAMIEAHLSGATAVAARITGRV